MGYPNGVPQWGTPCFKVTQFRLKRKENSWILKLDTLAPKGLYIELIVFIVQQLLLQIKFYYSMAARKKNQDILDKIS